MRTALLFNFLIEATIMASIAIVLMMLLRKTLRKPLGNKAICFGWLLIAARLLLPISIVNPWISSIRSPFSSDAAIRPIAGQIVVRTRDTLSGVRDLFSQSGNSAGTGMMNRAIMEIDYGNAGLILMRVYLIGMAAVLIWFMIRNVQFRLKLRAALIEPVSGKLLEQYREVCLQRGVKPIPVIFADPLPSACLVGVFRPYIALPLTASPAEVIHVLTHEICHLKNKDHLWSLLRLACCAVHWFNPLVWIAADMSRTDTELRCDDRVAAPLNEEQRTAYANVLVLAAARRSAPGVAVLATGMTMTGKKLKTRVMTVLRGEQTHRGLVIAFCVLSTLCLICAFATSELPLQISRLGTTDEMPHFVTQGMQGNVHLTDSDAAAAYALDLWQNVLGGDEAVISVDPYGDRYQVHAFETDTAVTWQMLMTDTGIVVDYTASFPDPDIAKDLNGEKLQDQKSEISQARDFMMPLIERLAPGITGRISEIYNDSVTVVGEAHYFYFVLKRADGDENSAYAIVRKAPDGTLRLIWFSTEGNG